jgi:hypothetical protein
VLDRLKALRLKLQANSKEAGATLTVNNLFAVHLPAFNATQRSKLQGEFIRSVMEAASASLISFEKKNIFLVHLDFMSLDFDTISMFNRKDPILQKQ